MKIAEIVKNRVDGFADGYIFTYDDFDVNIEKESALKIALYRLVKSGRISRLSKGRFYKPEKGIMSNLKPNEYEIVKDLLIDGNKTIGYITGYSIFNRLNLTTQVPNVIQIGVQFDKKRIKRDIYSVRFVRQWNEITEINIPLLQLLDCIRFIKIIPDATIANSLNRIIVLLGELSDAEKQQIVDLALNYPPSTRALVGAIFEQSGSTELSAKLFETLKSTSWYIFNLSPDLLPNMQKWKIK